MRVLGKFKAAALLAVAVMTLLTVLPAGAQGQITLNGAGSTFDNPLFSKAFSEYTKQNPNVRVNYQSVGSGAGIKQLTDKTVDFGASDAPMTDDQLKAAGGADAVVHIPVTLGAVAIAYNLPGVKSGLKLNGDVLSGIYLGNITKWNDAKIKALNPDVDLPSTDIAVVHRSDSSGTTDIFTTYLSSVSSEWKSKVASGTSVEWPVGIGAKGSEGVSGQVKQVEGAIGYFELAYATQNKLTVAAVADSTGAAVMPSPESAAACAAAAAGNLPADLRIRIAGCQGAGAYPISGFSWIILYTDQKDATRGAALVEVINWLLHDGQQYSTALSYAPLPEAVVSKATAKLQTVTANGQPLLAPTGTPAATPSS